MNVLPSTVACSTVSYVSFTAATSKTTSPLTSVALTTTSCVTLFSLVVEILVTLPSANTSNGFTNVNKRALAVTTLDIFSLNFPHFLYS